jgi:hypothetical protein
LIGPTEYAHGELLQSTVLPYALDRWVGYLQEFEQWARDNGMENKPLWLTEYGSLKAWCYREDQPNEVVYDTGGVGCLAPGGRGNPHVFYGRNQTEGLWGLMRGQISYLKREDHNWNAAWWFVTRKGDPERPVLTDCNETAWLWGDNYRCFEKNTPLEDPLGRAGVMYRDTLLCLHYGQNCPEAEDPVSVPGVPSLPDS